MSEVRIEVPKEKVVAFEIDLKKDVETVEWSDGSKENVTVLEFVCGPQGTWARFARSENEVICVTQSATMPPETYIVYEKVYIPDEVPEGVIA